jgi:multiple sugar transport system ATP-binding protein
MGDRIAVLNDGKLQQIGTPLELYYEPENQFVGTFIGSPSMNVVEGVYDGQKLDLGGFDYELTDTQRDRLDTHLTGGEVTLGIRPEDLKFVSEMGSRTAQFTASIVEPMGNENVVHLDHEMGEIIATIGGSQIIRQDDRVRARLPADHVHVFDGETGEAMFNRTRTEETAAGVVNRGGTGPGATGASGGDAP